MLRFLLRERISYNRDVNGPSSHRVCLIESIRHVK